MNSYLEKLLLEKDFEALTAEEQAIVRQQLSEEEYRQMRRICQAAPHTDIAQGPPARLREGLMQYMAAQPKAQLAGKVPLWLAACLLLLGMAAGWLMKPAQLKEVPRTQLVYQTDTVFQVKTVVREHLRWKEKIVFVTKTVPAPPEAPASLPQAFVIPELETTPTNGTSLADTPELMEFFTEGK